MATPPGPNSIAAAGRTLPPFTTDKIVPALRRLNNPRHHPPDLECIEFTPQESATFRFTVDDTTASVAGNMFGGNVASLTDSLTAVVLLGAQQRHVSTGVNVSYFRPAPLNTRVTVKCLMVFGGKTAKTLEARFLNDEGKLVAVGTHNMLAIAGPALAARL